MTILCGFDFSPFAIEAAETAAALAKATRGRLLLVHVHDALGAEEDLAAGGAHSARAQRLSSEAERLARGGTLVESLTIPGVAGDSLLAVAVREDARWIVVGARGGDRTLGAVLGGGTVHRVARNADRPVIIVRTRAQIVDWLGGQRPLRVDVGVDLDDAAARAVRFGRSLAELGPVDLRVVHVAKPDDAEDAGAAIEASLREELAADGASPQLALEVVRDARSPCEVVCERAARAGAGLVVIGRVPHSRLSRLMRRPQSDGVLDATTTNVAVV